MIRKSVTESFGAAILAVKAGHLTDVVVRRSKRMLLDALGAGLLGTCTPVFHLALQYSQGYQSAERSRVWGGPATLPPHYAAFVNGVAVHSMDFDDTWHPATHPSGPVLPALLALADTLPSPPSGLELLLAFNVGLEVQGRLLRFSREAHNIPSRFHPPAVVGVMGSTAASSKLLGLSPGQCAHALAIAASSAGAPMANAATQTKPLHVGNAARRGLEAALLARMGLEGNRAILDLESGFGVFYADYRPTGWWGAEEEAGGGGGEGGSRWILEDQDVAFKRFPAHLGMHWVVDAALEARAKLVGGGRSGGGGGGGVGGGDLDPGRIREVTLRVPPSRYVDCPAPATEHQARHSFQFSACSALLDGRVSVGSFARAQMDRPALRRLLAKVRVENPRDNPPSFDRMYCEVVVETEGEEEEEEGDRCHRARCDTFYGHWRKPLSQEDLVGKFSANAASVLTREGVEGVVHAVENLDKASDCSALGSYLQLRKTGL